MNLINFVFSLILTVLLLSYLTTAQQGINWKTTERGKWANGCDFKGRILQTIRVNKGELCVRKCIQTKGCTHYTWTKSRGGTCNLKTGDFVCESDAIKSKDQTMLCGSLQTCEKLLKKIDDQIG
jgi:hypothetical protein